MNLIWKAIKNMKLNPESIYRCITCNNEVFCHVNYINVGIPACNRFKCNKAEEVCKRMIEFRGWKFKSTFSETTPSIIRKIDFICENGHDSTLTFKNLKKGLGCKTCTNQNKSKDKPNISMKKICSCSGRYCEHYNHGILFPDSAEEWSNKNKISVYSVSPKSETKFIFECNKCNREYMQALDKRARGQRCPHCNSSLLVPYEKSLECISSNLVKEWSKDNKRKTSEICNSSNSKAIWECSICNHKWSATVVSRTGNKSGCPKCNCLNYDAMVGGHDYFVKRVNELHGDKYKYIGIYKNNYTKIDIECSIHGIFRQKPYIHLSGSGCPTCFYETHMSKGECRVKVILEELQIIYEVQKKFPKLIDIKDLKCDFYLPEHNLVIEFDGEQHFCFTKFSENDFQLSNIKARDIIKDVYMVKNKINLLRIPYIRFDSVKELIINALEKLKSSNHIYISYPDYVVKVAEQVNLDGIDITRINHLKLLIVSQ